MKTEMTIGVRVDGEYTKYDQFDPLKEKIDLFHEECAGGDATVVYGHEFQFACYACKTESGLYPRSDVRRALRVVMVCKTSQCISGSDASVELIPLPPLPPPPVCRKCKQPVDLKKNEHAVFHFADGPPVHLHTACATARPKEAAATSDEGRLNDLLKELQDIARQQAEPVPTKVAK